MCKVAEFDYSKLLGLIRERGLTQDTIAKEIARNPCTISQKLNNHGAFTAPEIKAICDILGIATNEVGIYFFTPKVQKVGIFAMANMATQ